jgi:hypothetical protein
MKHIFVLVALLQWYALFSQEQLGMRLENYAGVSSLSLNPAGNLTNPLKWDVNLAGAGAFFDNNYVYLHKTNFPELLGKLDEAEILLAENIEGRTPDNALVADFFDDKKKRFFNVQSFVAGPSVAIKLNDMHFVGLFTNFKAVAGSQNIPEVFSYYQYDRRDFFAPFQVHAFEGAMMSWVELGLNYAINLPSYNGSVGIGINLRYLQAYEGAYLENNSTFLYTKMPGNTFSVSKSDNHFAYTDSNLEGDGFVRQRNGSGFALDLGVVKLFQGDMENYKLKLGASLLDLGYLHFTKNANAHRILTDSNAVIDGDDYRRFTSLNELGDVIKLYSFQTLGDSNASYDGNSFRLALPVAISLQADYAITENVYLNTIIVQSINPGGITAQRNNLLALTPRFEHRWFSVSLPLVLYNGQNFHLGVAARLGFLVVGSDNVGSFFGHKNYTGTDFYFALKLNPFDLSISLFDVFNSGKRKHGNNSRPKCYKF